MMLIHLSTGLVLQAELSLPVAQPSNVHKVAILLHPWSWLGGCMDDPVLVSLVPMLRKHGFHTLRYNSRGVGSSSGRASPTGLEEGKDLGDLIKWAVKEIGNSSATDPPVSHVLISYPLGPLPLLTLFRSGTYSTALQRLVKEERSRVLIIYGDKDEFTGYERYRRWAEGLGGEGVEIEMVGGGTHFWGGSVVADRISVWLQ